MKPISYKRHRFPADVIRYAVYLYFRFTLSLRDVEELLAERGIEVSYETIRCWCLKFGPQIAAELKRRRPAPTPRWHLDEIFCSVGGKRMYLWKAVDDEGEILDMVTRPYRDSWTATKFIANILINSPIFPERITTDGLKSYATALRGLEIERLHRPGRLRENNGSRTATCQSDDENGRCRGSNPRPAPGASSTPSADLQHLLHSAPPDQPQRASHDAERGLAQLAGGRCSLIELGRGLLGA